MIRLVAVSPGGEVYITCDSFGTWRRHERYLPGAPVEISDVEAQRAILLHDFTQVEEEFHSWLDLDDRANQLVPRVNQLPPISCLLVRSILPELQDRVRLNGTPPDDIVRLVGRLLADERVAKDAYLRSSLGNLLSQRREHRSRPASTSRLSRMRRYYEPVATAA